MKNRFLSVLGNFKKTGEILNSKIKNKRKFLLFLISALIVIYLLISFLPYLISVIVGHRVENSENNAVAEISSNGELCVLNDNLILFNANGLQYYDFKGNHKHDIYFDAYSPYMNKKGNVLAAADKDGKSAVVIDENKVKYVINGDKEIQLISSNANSYSSIITGEKGYKSLVEVYNNKGEKVYEWHIGEYYAVDACVTTNNKHLAVLCVGIDKNDINSHIVFLDIENNVISGECEIKGQLAYKMTVENNCAYVLTDGGISCISNTGKVKKEYKFSGKELLAFDISDKNHMAVALNDNNSQSVVVLLNSGLKEIGRCNIPVQATLLDAEEEQVAVIGQNEIYVTNKNRIYAKGILSNDVECIKFSENKKHIVTSDKSSICIYDVKLGR